MSYTVSSKVASLDVSFGPEKAIYERLLFGSTTTQGIPSGDFYDMRGYPVPYTPKDTTDITLTLPQGSGLVGQNLKIEIIRDDPKTLPSYETVYFAPSSEVTSFGVRLDLGLNFIKLTDTYGDVVGSFSLSATRFATILYAIAVDMYTNLWEPVDATAKEIFDTHTGLFTNLLSFVDLLPESSSRHLLSNYLTMRALVTKAGTEEGIATLTQALFDQTPVQKSIQVDDWSAEWLKPTPPTTLAQVGREFHVWSYDAVASRIIQFGRLCKNAGKDVTQDRFGATTDGLEYDWRRYLDQNTRAPQDVATDHYDGHVSEIRTKLDMTFPWDDGKRSIVQFPGMWDGRTPYLDQGRLFDQGNNFDTDDTTGPLGFKGWVGVPVIPPKAFGEAASDGRDNMSVLVSVDIQAEMQNSVLIQSLKEKSTIEWGSDAFAVDAATLGILGMSAWSPTAHPNVPADTTDSTAAISIVLTSSSNVKHEHTVPLLTVAQWKIVLNGGMVTLTSNFNNTGDHKHTIIVSLVDLTVRYTVVGNHGHFVDVTVPGGLGL